MQLHLPSNGGGDVNNACSEVLMDCRLIQSCCHEMNRLLVFYSLVLSLSSSLLAIILWVPRAVGLPVSESGCVTVCFLFISHLLRVCWSPGAGQALGCNTKQRNRAWSLWTRLLGGQGRRFAQSEAECGKGGTEPQVTELFVQLCGQPGTTVSSLGIPLHLASETRVVLWSLMLNWTTSELKWIVKTLKLVLEEQRSGTGKMPCIWYQKCQENDTGPLSLRPQSSGQISYFTLKEYHFAPKTARVRSVLLGLLAH